MAKIWYGIKIFFSCEGLNKCFNFGYDLTYFSWKDSNSSLSIKVQFIYLDIIIGYAIVPKSLT